MSSLSSDEGFREFDHPSLVDRVAELADRIASGESVDLDEFARDDPSQIPELRRLLSAIEIMAELGGRPVNPSSPNRASEDDELFNTSGQLGDFKLVREIGRGGMGIVYEAQQLSLDRRVAVKVLPPTAAADPRKLQRFQLEAQAVGYLRHPHVVPVYTVGFDRGLHFFSMQFIEGQSLAEVLRALGTSADLGVEVTGRTWFEATTVCPEPPTLQRAGAVGHEVGRTRAPVLRDREYFHWVAQLGVQAAQALQHAHEQGVVHRDIKPGNLLLDPSGTLWVTDFGLARLQGDSGITMTGDLLGTLKYMSPEQASGGRVVVDGRTDVYSLGITLYELLTLQPAFEDEDRQSLLRRIIEVDPKPIRRINPHVPVDLETIVTKATAKEPTDRYATAGELAEELERFLDDRPIFARRQGPFDYGVRWIRRHRNLAMMLSAMVLIILFGLSLSLVLIGQEQGRTADALKEVQVSLAEAEYQRTRVELAAERARKSESYVRDLLYASDMRLANQALQHGDPRSARELLDRYLATPGIEDRRSFVWHHLNLRAGIPGTDLASGLGPTYCLERSPDGLRLAVAGLDATIRVFDLSNTNEPELTIATGQVEVNDVTFSPDGTILASAGDDGTLRLFSAVDGSLRQTVSAHDGLAMGVRFVNEATQILSYGHDGGNGAAYLWDVATGDLLWKFEIESPVKGLDVWEDTSLVMVLEEKQNQAFLLDLATGTTRQVFSTIRKPAFVAFAPVGESVVIGGRYGELMVIDLKQGVVSSIPTRISDGIETMTFNHDGSELLTGDRGGVIHVFPFEPTTGELLASSPVINRGEPLTVFTGKTWVAHEGRVYALLVLEDLETILSAGHDGRIVQWKTPKDVGQRHIPSEPVLEAQVRGGSDLLVVSQHDSGVWEWDLDANHPPRLLLEEVEDRTGIDPEAADESWIRSTSTPDGRVIAVATERRVVVLETKTGQILLEWISPRQPSFIRRLAITTDGRNVAVIEGSLRANGQGDHESFGVQILDVPSGREEVRILAPKAGNIAFSPEGTTLALSIENQIFVYEVATGVILHRLQGHSTSVEAVKFTPDGQRLLSVSGDRKLIIWDCSRWKPSFTTLAHRGPVASLDISPDGRLAATLGRDDRLKVWDLLTNQSIIEFSVDGQWIESRVQFTADGRCLTVNTKHEIVVFDSR
ncbi:serine/threonine-protein kinase [Tautonia rosea]|uniref:serine/threonine-protein kinase n=1 Tax=Tautonia rosea TaxID=2728037 RepID=UPI0014742C1F|nr:serine/threonine-protein kinase [Tautonia rosea]